MLHPGKFIIFIFYNINIYTTRLRSIKKYITFGLKALHKSRLTEYEFIFIVVKNGV